MKLAVVGEYPKEAGRRLVEMLRQRADLFERITIVDSVQKRENLCDAEIVVLRSYPFAAGDILRNADLRFIQKWGVGVETIDLVTAAQRGVIVSNTPGANAVAVAEHTIMLILSVLRRLIDYHQDMMRGAWTKDAYGTHTLKGKRVGLVGCGDIGLEVARRLSGFDVLLAYYKRSRLDPETEAAYGLSYMGLDELLAASDVVSLHIPYDDTTKGLIDRRRIGLLKPGAVLINTARGGVVDEEALARALAAGDVLGAGIDCLKTEPVSEAEPLLATPRVVLTPHTGGVSAETMDEMAMRVFANCVRFATDQKPRHVVNPG